MYNDTQKNAECVTLHDQSGNRGRNLCDGLHKRSRCAVSGHVLNGDAVGAFIGADENISLDPDITRPCTAGWQIGNVCQGGTVTVTAEYGNIIAAG